MNALSWITGWGGLLAVAKKAVYLAAGVAVLGLALWGWNGYRQADSVRAELDKTKTELTRLVAERNRIKGEFGAYVAQVGANAASEEQARKAREGEYRAQLQKIDLAAADRAAADRAAAQRLRSAAVRLAAQAAEDRRAIDAAAAAGDSQAVAERARVYADVFSSCRSEYGALAEAADRARSAGLQCQARYASGERVTGGEGLKFPRPP